MSFLLVENQQRKTVVCVHFLIETSGVSNNTITLLRNRMVNQLIMPLIFPSNLAIKSTIIWCSNNGCLVIFDEMVRHNTFDSKISPKIKRSLSSANIVRGFPFLWPSVIKNEKLKQYVVIVFGSGAEDVDEKGIIDMVSKMTNLGVHIYFVNLLNDGNVPFIDVIDKNSQVDFFQFSNWSLIAESIKTSLN